MRRHRIIAIPEIDSLVRIAMPAVFALVSEVLRHLRFFRKEVAGRVVGNLSEDAFRMTALTAQHPFRIGRHNVASMTFGQVVENRADTLLICRRGFGLHCERRTVFT
jgi:hypothetical protein